MTVLMVPGVGYARVNASRWIVDCPNRFCGSAAQLRPGDGFFCAECGTAADVVWPASTDAIEAALMLRPHWKNRNWEPGETVLDLLLENIRHGIPIVTHPELGASASRFVLEVAEDGTHGVRLLEQSALIDSAPLPIGA